MLTKVDDIAGDIAKNLGQSAIRAEKSSILLHSVNQKVLSSCRKAAESCSTTAWLCRYLAKKTMW